MSENNMKGLKNNKNTNGVAEDQEQEQSSFVQKAIRLRNKLKLGPHYKMERFTVMLGATLSFLLLFTLLSFVNHRSEVSTVASAQAIYTDQFTFSLSGQLVYVEGIYGNKEKTDVMMLLRMTDPKNMSADAKNYELFITGDKKSLKVEPKMSFSLFGATGYGIVRFQSDQPLEKQVLNIIIRSNSDLSSGGGTGASSVSGNTDVSFAENDQGQFFVNPGADGVETVKGIKPNEKDPVRLYMALVANAKDKEIHEEIESETKEMVKLLNRAQEYTNRLTAAGYEAPKEPWFIKGDYVDEEGVFRPATYLSQSYELDYWSKDISDGYINQVMKDMTEYDAYMKERSDMNFVPEEGKQEDVIPTETLKHEDGSVLDLKTVSTGESPSAHVAAKDAVESLEQTWNEYYSSKSNIQRDYMRELLILDADVQSQSSGYTIQDDPDYIWFY